MHSKYISIDIETTGLDPDRCQILEVGAVVETDWETPVEELPTFHCYVDQSYFSGEPFALALNHKILKLIADRNKPETRQQHTFHIPEDIAWMFAAFAEKNGIDPKHIVAAGKNFGNFDNQFLKRVPSFSTIINFKHRFIDPGMLYWDPATDAYPPSTNECLKRAGIDRPVSHTAVEDARDVITLVRHAQINPLAVITPGRSLEFKRPETRRSCIASSPVSAA